MSIENLEKVSHLNTQYALLNTFKNGKAINKRRRIHHLRN